MLFKYSILLFLLSIFYFECVASEFETCDLVQNLTSTTSFTFQSANYSDTNINRRYTPGSSCRVQFIAPQGFFIKLSGRISLDRQVDVYNCLGQGQKFQVSRDGMKDFSNSDLFCSLDTIAVNSISNEMTVGYTSETSGAGRFKVVAVAVKKNLKSCDCGWGYYVSW